MRRIAAMAETYDGQFYLSLVLDLPCSLGNIVAIAPHCPLGVSTFSHYLYSDTDNNLQPIALAACLQIGLCTPNHMIQEMSMGSL